MLPRCRKSRLHAFITPRETPFARTIPPTNASRNRESPLGGVSFSRAKSDALGGIELSAPQNARKKKKKQKRERRVRHRLNRPGSRGIRARFVTPERCERYVCYTVATADDTTRLILGRLGDPTWNIASDNDGGDYDSARHQRL